MKKQGFTLIELLAVIAILAIVLLIAIPVVLNMIERAKKGAFEDSVLSMFKAAETKITLSEEGIEEGYHEAVSSLDISNNNYGGEWLYLENKIYLCGVTNGEYQIEGEEKTVGEEVHEDCTTKQAIVISNGTKPYLAFKKGIGNKTQGRGPINVEVSPSDVEIYRSEEKEINIIVKEGETELYNGTGSYTITANELKRVVVEYKHKETEKISREIIIADIEVEIGKATELNLIRECLDCKYKLVSDIDLSSNSNFTPIGNTTNAFTGSFNGDNKTISNLTINRPTEENVGLFGIIRAATIKDVTLDEVNVNGKNYTGSLVGYGYDSIIENVKANGKIEGFIATGGLIGILSNSDVKNSMVEVTVIGKGQYTGGLVSYINAGLYENNYANVTITSSAICVGGLIGVFIPDIAGETLDIRRNYVTGNVTGRDIVGGVIGGSEFFADETVVVEENFFAGNVARSGTGSSIGGFMSEPWQGSYSNPTAIIVRNNYNTGNVKNVTTPTYSYIIGGFIGDVQASATATIKINLINNYSNANFTGSLGTPSGLIGFESRVSPTNYITGNYWDTTTSGNTYAVNRAAKTGVTGLATAGFKTTTVFSGWDTSIWEFSSDCYPVLKNSIAGIEKQKKLLGCQ